MRKYLESTRWKLANRRLSWRGSLKDTLQFLRDQLVELEKQPRDKNNPEPYRQGEAIRGAILVLDEMFWQLSHKDRLIISNKGELITEVIEDIDPRHKGWLSGTKNNKEPPKKGTL